MILAAWDEASPLLKMIRLEEQIKWASENGNFEKVSVFYAVFLRSNGFTLVSELFTVG